MTYQPVADEENDIGPVANSGRWVVTIVLILACVFPTLMFTMHASSLSFNAGDADAEGLLQQWARGHILPCVAYILACLIWCVRQFAPSFAYNRGCALKDNYRKIAKYSGHGCEKGFGLDMDVSEVANTFGLANTFTFIFLMCIGLICLLGRHLLVWASHVQNLGSFTTLKPDKFCTNEPMPELITDPECLCPTLGFVAMPMSYFMAKLTFGSFIQDLIFGNKNLAETKDKPLGYVSLAFVAYQFFCMFFMYARLAVLIFNGSISGTPLQIYGGAAFYLSQQSATVSMVLLASKMFVEMNVNDRGTAPWYFGLGGDGSYKLPNFSTPKERVFWGTVLSLAPICLAGFFTHYVFVILLVLGVGVLFPLWGTCLLALWAFNAFSNFTNLIEQLIITGASMHMEVWIYGSFAFMLMLMSIHMREKLWVWLMRFRRKDAPYGYLNAVSVVVFAFPVTLSMQCLTSWAVLAYDGQELGKIVMWDNDMRQFALFNACLVAKDLAPVYGRVLSWAGFVL